MKNTFDADGALSQVQSKRSSETYRNFANGFVYNAAGAVTAMKLGNGRWENTTFNSRLQPTQIGLGAGAYSQSLLKLEYSYGTTANNGNVVEQKITVPGVTNPFVQAYTYDELNRLKSATETQDSTQTWKQTYQFDRYGNRNFDEANTTFAGFDKLCSGNTVLCSDLKKRLNPSINTSNNRLSTSDDYAFDASGNTTSDPDDRTFIYDAENKQIEVKDSLNDTIGEYSYDGDGRRIKKYVPSTGEVTVFVYDAGTKLIGEYSTVVQPVQDAKTVYTTNDHLGSPRINTDATGQVISRHDYHPFGEEVSRSGYGSDTIRKQFTGYERDGETGLDFAQARMYAPILGRFTRPDDVAGDRFDPQSLNRFVYVLNNPLNLIDPTGFSWENPHTDDTPSKVWADLSEFQSRYPVWREWVNNNGRPLWVPPDEYAAKQTDRSRLPLWTEMTYESQEGIVTLDSRGPNPDTPWGWSLDRVAVGDPSQPAQPPSAPGQNVPNASATGTSPMIMSPFGDPTRNLLGIYFDADARRSRAQALFPDSRGLDAERHRWATRQTALRWGTGTARTLGILNEIQGFIWHDAQPLAADVLRANSSGMFVSTRANWAFQWSDLQHNEVGIAEATVIMNRPR